MLRLSRGAVLPFCVFLLALSVPEATGSLRVATTLYEDLRLSDLVVTGSIIAEADQNGFISFDLAVDQRVHGEAKSPVISILVLGNTPNTKDGSSIVASAGVVSYVVGEEVLVFLKKHSREGAVESEVGRGGRYSMIRTLRLKDLEGEDKFMGELRQLVTTLKTSDSASRESVFLKLLSSDHELIVESAVKELGRMGSHQSLSALAGLLSHESDTVRFQVVDALRHIGGKQAIAELVSGLGDPSARIRARAASNLGWMRATGAEDQLIQVVQDPIEVESVRINAVLALGHMGSTRAIPILEEILNEEDLGKTLRGTLETTLQRLRQSSPPSSRPK